MKLFKVMTLIVSVLCCVKLSNAQDVIVMKDNKTILSKVTKVSQTEIEYKKWSDLDGPTYIINKSEVSNINYENGERDIFDSQTGHPDTAKTMMRVGRNLMLDNKLLTDEEVRSMFGEKDYATYISARRQMDAGSFFTVIFMASLCWDFICVYGVLSNAVISEPNPWGLRLLIGGLVTDISLPLMCVFGGIGKGRLSWLADEYNEQHQGYSLNLSPSVIRCSTPQSQNNYGLGLTLSLNF